MLTAKPWRLLTIWAIAIAGSWCVALGVWYVWGFRGVAWLVGGTALLFALGWVWHKAVEFEDARCRIARDNELALKHRINALQQHRGNGRKVS